MAQPFGHRADSTGQEARQALGQSDDQDQQQGRQGFAQLTAAARPIGYSARMSSSPADAAPLSVRQVLLCGAAIVTLSLLTLPLALWEGVSPYVAALSWAAGAFGMGLAVPSISVQVMRLSPETDLGVNSSAIQIIDSVMGVLVVSLLGLGHAAAVASGGASAATYAALWCAAALVSLAAVVLAGRMRPV